MKNLFQTLQCEVIDETLSPQLIHTHRLMSLTEALYNIHFPQSPDLLRKAQYRLKFEELFYIQLNILRYTKERRNKSGVAVRTRGRSFQHLLFTESSFSINRGAEACD